MDHIYEDPQMDHQRVGPRYGDLTEVETLLCDPTKAKTGLGARDYDAPDVRRKGVIGSSSSVACRPVAAPSIHDLSKE
jgi:hypothetical protein